MEGCQTGLEDAVFLPTMRETRVSKVLPSSRKDLQLSSKERTEEETQTSRTWNAMKHEAPPTYT